MEKETQYLHLAQSIEEREKKNLFVGK